MEPQPEDMKTIRGVVDFRIRGRKVSATQAAEMALVAITEVMAVRKVGAEGEDIMPALLRRTAGHVRLVVYVVEEDSPSRRPYFCSTYFAALTMESSSSTSSCTGSTVLLLANLVNEEAACLPFLRLLEARKM